MVTLSSLVSVLEALDPTAGGYRMDSTDRWRAHTDATEAPPVRAFLVRVIPRGLTLDGEQVSESVDLDYAVPHWAGPKTFTGLEPLYAYDIARRSAIHLAEALIRSMPYAGTAGGASISIEPAISGWLAVSISLTLNHPMR